MLELSEVPAGTQVVVGNRVVSMPTLRPGDRVIPVSKSGELVVISAAAYAEAERAVAEAEAALAGLASCSAEQVSQFFRGFAQRLAADATWQRIEAANRAAAAPDAAAVSALTAALTKRSDS